jgi:putative ABC transport system permease protein
VDAVPAGYTTVTPLGHLDGHRSRARFREAGVRRGGARAHGIRDYGVLKAIGLTPGQVVSTVISSHAALALLGSLAAIPLGIGLYLALYAIAGDSTEAAVLAPWWSLALIPVGTVVLVVAATSLPAWLGTRIPPADALRYE